jgi:hypothetical protein
MSLCVPAHVLFEQLAGISDGCEQKHAWYEPKKTERRLYRLNLRNYDCVCHVFSFFSLCFAFESITMGYV